MKLKAVVFDIDSTIFDSGFILEEIHSMNLKDNEKWDYYYKNCNSDRVKPFPEIYLFWYRLSIQYEMFFSTARNEKCREETLIKLQKHRYIPSKPEFLYMRKDGDLRPASVVKREHLEEILKNYDIIAFIDDDLANCKMAKELGILALRKV